MSTNSTFTITELAGQRRSIELVGRGLPYRPFTLGSSQRVNIRWNGGSPVATATLLGASEPPTTINGAWKTKFLTPGPGEEPPFSINNRPVFTTQEAIKIFDSVCQEGSQLRVTWMTYVRIGHLEEFIYNIDNANDAAWTMNFLWVSRGQPPGPVALSTSTTLSDTVSRSRSLFDLFDAIPLPNFGLVAQFTNALVNFVNNIQNAIYALEDALLNVVRKILNPIQAIRGLIAIFRNIGEEAALMRDFLYSFPASTLMIGTIVSSPSQEAINNQDEESEPTPADKMEAERFRRQMVAWADEMRRLAEESESTLTIQSDGELMGTYTARELEDLRDVSRQFYGTPFEWRRLMVFNNLATIELRPGQVVLVPKLNEGLGSQLDGGA